MWISDIALDDYRSYSHSVMQLHQGVNVLMGSNGQGKTNFVEAIHYLSTFRSHRVNADQALVRMSAEETKEPRGAVVRVKLHTQGRERLIDVEIVSGKANRARLNRNQVNPREIRGIIHSVLFAPEDVSIIRTDPATRRHFIDELATQSSLHYATWLSDYMKIAHQRSAFLRNLKYSGGYRSPEASTMLQVWNDQLVQVGSRIIAERACLLRQLEPLAAEAHHTVCQAERELTISYQPHLPGVPKGETPDWEVIDQVDKAFYNSLATVYERELERGINLVGPHRDDVHICLDNVAVKGFASHGETWSVALALRLAEFELLSHLLEERPILILDDVFAELDTSRRDALTHVIEQAEQVLITAAVEADVPETLDAHYYDVRMARNDAGERISCISARDKAFESTANVKDSGDGHG
ncbi:MAG: DNA replication/repair protein RecF [Actinomycetaceae bacterium]|nr:DNA replication/repair protein RecF [Actinomycetaceae bacterium]